MSNKRMNLFQSYGSLKSVVISCFRRLLTYTLFRHWGLAQLVLQDTIAIFQLGEWLDLFMASAVKNLKLVLLKASSLANIIVSKLTKSQNGGTPMLYNKYKFITKKILVLSVCDRLRAFEVVLDGK